MMRRVLADLLHGTILAAVAAGISCLLALVGYGRPYYLSVFLPVSMLGYLLIAWLLYLRRDRFMRSPGAMRAEGPLPDEGRDPGPAFPRAKQALLWAAAELAVAATLLYSLWGIGATYHG
jgi:hypothetical protein